MKRVSRIIILALVLILTFQTGCSRHLENGENSSSDVPESKDDIQQVTEETSETEPLTKASILDNREPFDEEDVLWYVPNERIEKEIQQQILWFNDNLLVWSNFDTEDSFDLKLALISEENGDVLYETMLTDFELPNVQACGGLIAVTDWVDGDVCLLNSELKIVKEYQSDNEYCALYLSTDASKLYRFTEKTGVIIIDIESGTTEVLLENAAGIYINYGNSYSGNIVPITYTDMDNQLNYNGVVDLETGEVHRFPFSGTFYCVEYDDEIWLAGNDITYYLGNEEELSTFTRLDSFGTVNMLSNPTRILSTSYDMEGNSAIVLYDINGSFISKCNISREWGGLFTEPLWSQDKGGYYFIVTDSDGTDKLLFWDLSTPVAGEDLILEPLNNDNAVVGTAVSESLYNSANVISEKYGVKVKIAELCEEVYEDFTVEKMYDEEYISLGLDTLERVLASYPEGFIQQLRYGDQKELEIILGGRLTKNTLDADAEGFTSFAGFTQEQSGRSIVVVDITDSYSLEASLHHEIMHLIDNKLMFDATLRAEAVYSEDYWCSLNPEGFAYAESYNNIPDVFYNDGYDSWFIDIYARTFSKEDRARIMEYAMAGYDDMYIGCPERCAKLEYICRCIRDAFDTTGWPEKTVWEEVLARCS